ncbi:small conductance mechanosensitive channel [Brevibacterium sanguinis]|uniref:Small conductance mechanosensitive channel n=2 Tax=Brevibacterium TaxID=1696 RepID=A0A366IP58_9MICO|nr:MULTISPECIES: mechanosensitive ion channel family protein [Brevibacterium]RBP66467.1 small conductance mechanosensitive channel [Brevibacterium sanguinis]RBP73119.1 small conductance mechanosensitive channel [Brevibacterium celere]
MTYDVLTSVLDTASDFQWEFLLGAPLRIFLIIVMAIVLNFMVRLLIRRFAAGVAKGTVGSSKTSRNRFSASNMQAQLSGFEPEIVRERRAQRANTVGRMLSSVSSIFIVVVAVLMILTELEFNLGPILASAGVAGVAIGFGAQALVKDYLSGFFMVVEDQYGIGDTVDLGEAIGTVEDVGLRITQVRGLDGTLWHVRNGEILRVGNQSQGWARAVLDIPIAYNTTMDTYSEIIAATTEAVEKDPEVADAILEKPEIWGVESLSAESQVVRTVLKTKPNQQWMVARAFRAELKRQMDRRGIQIPITQETVFRTLPDPTEAIKIAATNETTEAAHHHDSEGHEAHGDGSSGRGGDHGDRRDADRRATASRTRDNGPDETGDPTGGSRTGKRD